MTPPGRFLIREDTVRRTFFGRSIFVLLPVVVALVTMLAAPTACSDNTPPEPVGNRENEMIISPGNLVTFEYTLTGDDGNVIDTSEGGQPFVYTHGRREIVEGLETRLAGMRVGESKLVTVEPERGYGVVNEQAFIEVPIDRIPEEAREVGRQLQGTGPEGQPVQPVVKEVRESVVVLDFNHPLADQTLHFDVKILSIEEQPETSVEEAGAAGEVPPEE